MDAQDRDALRAARFALGLVRFDWSAQRIALVTRRWAEGASASRIAKELGPSVSRCAVLGKIHRLKLPRPKAKQRRSRKAKVRLRRLRARRHDRRKRRLIVAP